MNSKTQNQGYQIEQKAMCFLQSAGLVYIRKNFHCAYGEIDLIMQDKNYLVFVEVRSRNNSQYGNAVESIVSSKQKKLIKTASYYLQQNNLYNKVDCRFDVIGQDTNQKLYWIKNALEVQY